MRFLVFWMAVCFLGCSQKGDPVPDIAAREVLLPDGTRILAEPKIDRNSQAVGMMYRDSLPKDRGMLFFYNAPAKESYWMHNVRVPLDIIWLDASRKVVEIAANAEPCLKPPQQCPAYGGHEPAQYVLELNGGEAKRHGVAVGADFAVLIFWRCE